MKQAPKYYVYVHHLQVNAINVRMKSCFHLTNATVVGVWGKCHFYVCNVICSHLMVSGGPHCVIVSFQCSFPLMLMYDVFKHSSLELQTIYRFSQ